MRLENKTAIVTGSASGIGLGIAEKYADEGANVVITDIVADGEVVAENICQAGGKAIFIQADLRSETEVRELMQQTIDTFGSLDILVNNAGVTCRTTVLTADDDEWDRVMNTNLKGAWYCCKHAIPLMIERGGGSIVNISSTHVTRTQWNHFPYHSAKAGLHAMTHGLTVDFGDQGIRANNICPGFIMTPMGEKWLNHFPDVEKKKQAMLAHHPVGRFGTPEDVAAVAVFLASDEASFISGSSIVVDGGRSALQRSD